MYCMWHFICWTEFKSFKNIIRLCLLVQKGRKSLTIFDQCGLHIWIQLVLKLTGHSLGTHSWVQMGLDKPRSPGFNTNIKQNSGYELNLWLSYFFCAHQNNCTKTSTLNPYSCWSDGPPSLSLSVELDLSVCIDISLVELNLWSLKWL